MTELSKAYPVPPPHAAPYVHVLGVDLTVQFLLKFGGADLYLPENPCGKSLVEALVRRETSCALRANDYQLQARVPQTNPWIAGYLHVQG